MPDTLLASIDSTWDAADAAALTPDHAARLAELQQLDAALAALYARGAEVLAGALHGLERGLVELATTADVALRGLEDLLPAGTAGDDGL